MGTFNTIIRELRKEIGNTQKEVAEMLGISTTCYAGYEQGSHEPAFEILVKIANYFDVSTDYLLGITEDEGAPRLNAPAPAALPLDESELLKNYRALSYVGKARVSAYADLLREQEEGATGGNQKKA